MSDRIERHLRDHLASIDHASVTSIDEVQSRAVRWERRHRARNRAMAGIGCVVLVAVGGGALWALRSDPSVVPTSDGAPTSAAAPSPSASQVNEPVVPSGPAPDSTAVDSSGLSGEWTPIPADPDGVRVVPSVVWTGSEALVVGGTDEDGTVRPDAVSYDPAARSWRRLADPPVTTVDPLVVWTGGEMLVIGGTAGSTSGPASAPASAGHAYDPASDSWRATAPPFGAIDSSSPWAWTGGELLVWSAAAPGPTSYDPSSDSWKSLGAAPIVPRTHAASVWTGTEWLIWGGTAGGVELDDGAAYDPVTATWRVLADSPLSARRVWAVWTGTEMIVDAGSTGGAADTFDGAMALSDGAAYDPATDSWRSITSGFAHPGFVPVWTGTQVVMFAKGAAVVYDVATDRWVDSCCGGAPGATPVWIGDGVLLIGSFDGRTGGATFSPPPVETSATAD
jgi:hypothetical protein